MKIMMLCLAITLSAVAQEPNALFREVRPDLAATLEPAALSLDAQTVRRRYVALNAAALDSGLPVVLNLFDDVTVTIDGSKFHRLDDGTLQFADVLPSQTWSQVTMGISGGTVHGTVHLDRKVYELRSITPDTLAIEEIDMTQPIAVDTPLEPEPPLELPLLPVSPRTGGARRMTPQAWKVGTHAVPNLTVLAVNSPLLCALPGAAASQAANFQANLNLAFSFNFQPIASATVISVCVNHWPSNDIPTELNWVKADATVASLRNQHRADVVSFIVPNAQPVTGGLLVGQAVSVNTGLNKADAFNVVAGSYATSSYTLAHEIGHNLGMNHDRTTANAWGSDACNFGYCQTNGPRDIMAYDSACSGSFQAGVFSTPLTQNIGGFTFGPYGVSCSAAKVPFFNIYRRANNLKTLTDNAATAAGWY